MPGIAFGLAGFSEPFHDEAYRVGRPLWRVRSAGRQKQNISFADRLALPLAGTIDIFKNDVSFQLIKEFVTRIDVEISADIEEEAATVRPASPAVASRLCSR